MEVLVLPVGAGKTEQLIQWLLDSPADEHRILVSHDYREAHRVMRLCYDRGLYMPAEGQGRLESWQFMGVEELRSEGALSAVIRHRREARIVLCFDNLDLWLQNQFPHSIQIVTMTGGGS